MKSNLPFLKSNWAYIGVPLGFALCGAVFALTLAGRKVLEATDRLSSYRLTDYVAGIYMPAQRRLTGKWPTNLDGLPNYFRADKKRNVVTEVMRNYYDNYESLEVIKVDKKAYHYRIRLKNRTADCHSSINPDEGYCP